MKKLLSFIMFVFLVTCIVVPSKAASVDETQIPICTTVNDTYIYTDADPFLTDGTTFVPIRFVSEALGVDSVEWDHPNKTAIIRDGSTEIQLPIGEDYAYVNGEYTPIRQGVKLVSNRTFVPIRFVSETLGADVYWDQSTYKVKIYKDGVSVPDNLVDYRGYTDEDILWLARIIEAESSGETMNGKIGVGNVILNRVASSEYPNTIYGVIFDDEFGIQFTPVANGAIHNTPSNTSVIAAKIALEGGNTAGDSLYFLNPAKASSSWITQSRPYYSTIGNHSFYL